MSNRTEIDATFNFASGSSVNTWPTAVGTGAGHTFTTVSSPHYNASLIEPFQNVVKKYSSGVGSLAYGSPTFSTVLLSPVTNVGVNGFNGTSSASTTINVPPVSAPPANKTIILQISQLASSNPNAVIPTVSGCNATWVQVSTAQSSTRRVTVFAGVASSPSTANFVVTTSVAQTNMTATSYVLNNSSPSTSSPSTIAHFGISNALGVFNAASTSIPVTFATTPTDGSVNYAFVYKFGSGTGPGASHLYQAPGGLTLSVGDIITTAGSAELGPSSSGSASLYVRFNISSGPVSNFNIPILSSSSSDTSPIATYSWSIPVLSTSGTTTSTASRVGVYFFGSKDGTSGRLTSHFRALVGYAFTSKGVDEQVGGGDDLYGFGVEIQSVDAGGNVTSLASYAGPSELLRSGEIWNFSLSITQSGSQYIASFNWNIPNNSGKIVSPLITKVGDSSGLYFLQFPNSVYSFKINLMSVANLKPAMQGISRSANW